MREGRRRRREGRRVRDRDREEERMEERKEQLIALLNLITWHKMHLNNLDVFCPGENVLSDREATDAISVMTQNTEMRPNQPWFIQVSKLRN